MIPNATDTASLPPRAAFALPIRVIREGGITAWLVEDQSVPVVSLEWSWQGGAALDAPEQVGRMALAFAMLTEGAGELNHLAFTDAARDNGIVLQFGAGRDTASGGFRALRDSLPEAVRLAKLAMTAPRLDAPDLDRVRARSIVAVRQAIETPRGAANRAFWAAAYPGHPAGRSATPDSLAAIPREALLQGLSAQLRRDGVLVGAAGAITEDELRALLREMFAGLPAQAPAPLPSLPAMADFAPVVEHRPAPQSSVMFGQEGPLPDDPRWEATQVALRILGGSGFSSRLMRQVREERGLTYGIGAGLDVVFGRAVVLGQASTDNARVAEMLGLTREIWARMAADGPLASELEEAVDYLNGTLPLQFSDSRRIAGGLLSLMQNNRTPAWLQGRPARLSALTVADVAAAARQFGASPLRVVVAGQPVGL
ncbi:insulinase family protein [Rhodovarius crocodyli]|uniref:Insulinase family protein n=1 Tax=Rhodovarius crocodyli TaxID=1979269 RepID=A0A437MD36_9PROT|nr:pitrilysin family protein [Rhodovarius crocodyli]RVT95542.1 insulinase family protein [Rhodovarius crocodyli]